MIADSLFWLAQTVGASSARVGDGNEITCPAQLGTFLTTTHLPTSALTSHVKLIQIVSPDMETDV